MSPLIGERYEVIEPIGKGGMATVFRARDSRLLRDVAVKVLLDDPDNEETLFYFHREARAIASLQHPNIIQIHDYSGPDEIPTFIVMQLVEGGNLENAMLKKKMTIPEIVLISIARSVAVALEHAHEKGVIHRDLKPTNVMVDPSGRLLLTDFGLAKAYADTQLLGETVAGQNTSLFGTPDFMAPEQLRKRQHGPHSDVFSLGAMLHYLSTGKLPFSADTPMAVARKVVFVDCAPLETVRDDLSSTFVKLVHSCMAREPADRLSAADLASYCTSLLNAFDPPDAESNIRRFLEGKRFDVHRYPSRRVPSQALDEVRAKLGIPKETTWGGGGGEEGAGSGNTDTGVGLPPADRTLTDIGVGNLDKTLTRPDPQAEKTMPGHPISEGISEKTELAEVPPPRSEVTHVAPVDRRQQSQTGSSTKVLGATALLLTIALGGALMLPEEDAAPPPKISIIEEIPSPQTSHTVGVPPIVPSPAVQPSGPTVPPPSEQSASEPQPIEPVNLATPINDTDDPPPTDESSEERTEARSKGRRRKGPGTIKISAKPWATIFVDEERRGDTPRVSNVKLPAGAHVIRAEHPVYGSKERRVSVQSGKTVRLTFDFFE